jgi:hypothetical protein
MASPAERADALDIIDAAAREFDRKQPGFEVEGYADDGELYVIDNYFEASYDFISAKLRQAGHDPTEYDAEIDDAIDWARERDAAITRVAYGGDSADDRAIARSYFAVRDQALRAPLRLPCHGRHRRAPARRPARRRGSRRASGVRTSQDPGDGDPEPPGGRRCGRLPEHVKQQQRALRKVRPAAAYGSAA